MAQEKFFYLKKLITQSLIFSLLLIYTRTYTGNFQPGTVALVQVPVADLLWESAYAIAATLPTAHPELTDPTVIYHNLGLGDLNCLRAYQLLLHEQVLILAERGPEVQIAVPHIFYLTGSKELPELMTKARLATQLPINLRVRNNSHHSDLPVLTGEYSNSFWTLKANLIPLSELARQGVNLNNLPIPINFQQPACRVNYHHIVTLIKPYYDPVTQQHYSAGTRFKLVERASALAPTATELVWCFDQVAQKLIQLSLPTEGYTDYSQIDHSVSTNFNIQKQNFVALLRSWTQLQAGQFVPYVYSGASVIQTCSASQCPIQPSVNILGQPTYTRVNYPHEPSAGLDCSCLISRAAQIVGMAYFYKNSATIERNLTEISELSELEAGDILWHPGHVMVVSDVAQGRMIEARGYRPGFGCLHEVQLSQIFAGISSYAELWDALQNQRTVRTLDSQGQPFGAISRFKLLKLAPDQLRIP